MSGAVAAHAAHNGSGTQGLAVTNALTSTDGGDVQSVFYNRNDTVRQVLYGSAIVEIPASGNGGSLTSGSGNQLFSVNSDIDALGDLYLQITLTGASGQLSANKTILDVIKRVEFKVATQVYQTLSHEDIFVLNSTELSEGAFESYFYDIAGGRAKDGGKKDGIQYTIGATAPLTGARQTTHRQVSAGEVTCVVRLPCLSRTISPMLAGFANVSEGAYLMAGATGQNVKINVYTNALSGITTHTGVELKLFGKQMVMTNAERGQFTSTANPNGLPKRAKTSQNHVLPSTISSIAASGELEVNLDLDHFSLYASHLVIALGDPDCHIKKAELKLNSSSFSGELDGGLLTGPVADSMGLHFNQFYAGGVGLARNYYVFPLASQAYGSSSVPLNRFDNIRLILTIRNQNASTAISPKISVTCVGETTILYKNNAASLAMY